MSVKKLFTTGIVLVALTLSGVAQSAPPTNGTPAHPFLGMDIVPQAPKAAPTLKSGDDLNLVPNNGPATPVAPNPAQTITPAQPGQDPTALPSGHPQVDPSKTPVAPGQIQIITDPRVIQQLFGGGAQAPVSPTPEMLEGVYMKVWQQVVKTYHNPKALKDWDQWAFKYKGKLQTTDDLENAIKDMLGSLHDPWTKYISTAEIKKRQEMSKNGVSDLGIWLVKNDDGSFRVDYTTYGTPSYMSGLHKGDLLKSAQGKELKGLSQDEAEALLMGKDGMKIDVVYVRNGQERKETLTVAKAVEGEVQAAPLAGGIAYIRFPTFDQENFMVFVQTLQELHEAMGGQMNGLILDLRGNSGGLVNVALQLVSIFMDHGVVVTSTTRGDGRYSTQQTYEINAPQRHDFLGAPPEAVTMIKDFYNVPMVVLVDGSSASSSEITTGALKDSGRATIVGTTTYGKGVGYNMGRIPPGGILYITSLDYVTPSGYNLSNKGIPPQVVVERTPGSKVDEQLVKAIEVLKAKNPDAFADPATKDNSKKSLGEGDDWTSSPLAIAGAIALILLVLALFARNHFARKARDEAEAKRDREAGE